MAQRRLTHYARKTELQNASQKQKHSLRVRTGRDWKHIGLSKKDATDLITPLKNGDWEEAKEQLKKWETSIEEIDYMIAMAVNKRNKEQGNTQEKTKEQNMEPETPWDQEQNSGQTQEEQTETGHGGEEVEFTQRLKETLNILNDSIRGEIEQEIKGLIQGKVEELKQEQGGPIKYQPQEQEYFKPEIFDKVCAYLSAGLNVLIYGPAGCGKSKLAQQAAASMNKDFFAQSFSGGARYSQVFGSQKLTTDENGNQKTEFQATEFMHAMTQENMLVLGDEIFSLEPEAAQGLNGFLEPSTGKVETPDGTFHKQAQFIGTANTAGRTNSRQYTAPQRQDDSLLDRFIAVYMDYDPRVEEAILRNMGVDQATIKYFIETTQKVREIAKEQQIPFDPSTRRLITAAKGYHATGNAEEAFTDAMLSSLSQGERRKIGY